MITLNKYEGKTEEEAMVLCLKDLSCDKENIYTSIETENGGLFKGKKIVLKAISKEKIISDIKEFLNTLSKYMDLDIHSEIKIEDSYIHILLVCDNNAILIGKDGKNLDAIQTIMRQYLSNLSQFHLQVIVDASNYKEKKKRSLEFEMKKICKDVLKSKVDVKLDPMNSYERRIVHTVVSEFDHLESISYGEGKDRYTVIKYKD